MQKKKLNLLRATRCIFRIDIKEKKTVILKMPTSVKVEPYYPQIGLNAPPPDLPELHLNPPKATEKQLRFLWRLSEACGDGGNQKSLLGPFSPF